MYYVGVDLGGTKIAVGLTDENARIISKDSIPTFADRESPEIISDMAALVRKLIDSSGVNIKDVKCIGIGVPGITDDKATSVVYTVNLNFRNFPIGVELKKYFDIPVFLENDANVAALAESITGAARGAFSSVMITLGTGVGGGIVIDGKIYRGFNGIAGEFGHMVIALDGLHCNCGRKGCWETYASATALIRQTQDVAKQSQDSLIFKMVGGDLSKINAKTSFDAAKKGDKTGLKVVDKYIGYVAEGITNVINIIQPEVLVVGGGISREGEYLLKPLRELIEKKMYTYNGVPNTLIKVAMLGNDAGIAGAAMLAKIKYQG